MTLLREIQLLLERTYAPVAINLEACVIGESRCAVLNRLAGEEARHLAAGGRTFLRQAGDSLYVAIFYARPVIEELEANDPRRALNERNLPALITFVEEIAHGVQAALLFQEGEREITSENYARNLETQARVDTYLVLSKFAQMICGNPIPRPVGRWLQQQLFDSSYRSFATAQLRQRYKAAQKCAVEFLRYLRCVPLSYRAETLRKFRRFDWMGKLEFVQSHL